MSTHFRPCPPSSAPSSPVRPASARSTIRAITPSPPPSLAEAMRLQYADSGIPSEIPSGLRGRLDARPKSDGLQHTQVQDFNGGEAKHGMNMTEGSGLGGGGELRRRSSPVKRGSQSQSPRKRPYSKPTNLPQNREQPLADLGKEKVEEQGKKQLHSGKVQRGRDSDIDADCPETPTPMTTSQKRSAYLPMGTPASFTRFKRPADAIPSPAVANNPTGEDGVLAAEMNTGIDNPSYSRRTFKPSAFGIKHPQSEPSHGDLRIYVEARRERLRAAKAARNAEKAQPSPFTQPGHVPQHIRQDLAHADHSRQFSARPRVPEAWVYRARDTHMHLSPSQAVYNQNAPTTANPARHVSISAISNVSGGTANSKRSIFSTPGRDEMERKKAFVEEDEGPFGRAVSMADLNETRRRISEGIQGVEDGEKDAHKAEIKGQERKGICGFGCSCLIM